MSDTSPLLSLPYIQAAQAQKHVTHNEAIELLDAVTQLSLEAIDAVSPPTTAAEGQAWAVGAGASGAWASRAGDLAAWRGGGWLFITPQTGWVAWDKTTAALYVWTPTGWISQSVTPGFNNLSGVGINATSDSTNKLAVAADATLLSHDGTGHQLKINKAGATDTASLLYQTNWSGRAEMGLAGNDDFAIKVSADGTTFTDALRIDAATGEVALPATGTRQLLPFNYRYYFYTDRRWVGPAPAASSLNASTSLGTNAEPNLDWDAKGLFVPAGSVINAFTLAGSPNSGAIGDLDLRIYFQYGPWNNAWKNTAATNRVTLYSADAAGVIGTGGMIKSVFPLNYVTPDDGYFMVAARHDAGSTLTSTQYLYSAGALDITLPPSV